MQKSAQQFPLDQFLLDTQTRNNRKLEQLLPDSSDGLIQAMRYSLLSNGKRIRPALVYASAQAITDANKATDVFACAVEIIHTYSLIHDDLPAMDNDDLRRGRPTCHTAFDEATAILAGDALQCLAFEVIANSHDISPKLALTAIQVLTHAAGEKGMVLGQAIDLASTSKQLRLEQLAQMHKLKTGALIKASILLGAYSAAANNEQIRALEDYADAIGLAFQIHDDILDVTSETDVLGKTKGSDLERNKPTYVSLMGLKAAQEKANTMLNSALQALEAFDEKAAPLRSIACYIVDRNH